MAEEVYLETCPDCGSDAGHYSKDGSKPGDEIWLCNDCSGVYIVVIKNGS